MTTPRERAVAVKEEYRASIMEPGTKTKNLVNLVAEAILAHEKQVRKSIREQRKAKKK